MKKYPRIEAPEVVPGKIYLVPHRINGVHSWRPATVNCTEESGWLRGFVEIAITRSTIASIHGQAEVRFVDDGTSINIPLCRHVTLKGDSPWVFSTGVAYYEPVTLRELPPTWFDEQIHQMQLEIDEAAKRIDRLKDIQSSFRALKQKVDQHSTM